MKKTIIALSLVLVTALGYAQNSKGTHFLGITNDITASGILDIQMTPSFGYFIKDGLVIGSSMNYDLQAVDTRNTFDYTITPFLRKYLNEKLFVTAETPILLSQYKGNSSFVSQLVYLGLSGGVGYSFMLNEKVAIEPILLYGGNRVSGRNGYIENDESVDWNDWFSVTSFSAFSFNVGLSLRL